MRTRGGRAVLPSSWITSSEEVQSANEELQRINEELETSKEELESANEELITVNDEMSHRNAELGLLNSDLINIQTSAHQAMLVLAPDLTVRRFSAQAEKQFHLIAADVGRPFTYVRHNLDIRDLGYVPRLIAMTGCGQPADVVRSREAGFEEHLVKPVDVAALVTASHQAERSDNSSNRNEPSADRHP